MKASRRWTDPDLTSDKSCTGVCLHCPLCRWENGGPMCHCIGDPSLRQAKSWLPLSPFLVNYDWTNYNRLYCWVCCVLPVPTSYPFNQDSRGCLRSVCTRYTGYGSIPLSSLWGLVVFDINIPDMPHSPHLWSSVIECTHDTERSPEIYTYSPTKDSVSLSNPKGTWR